MVAEGGAEERQAVQAALDAAMHMLQVRASSVHSTSRSYKCPERASPSPVNPVLQI